MQKDFRFEPAVTGLPLQHQGKVRDTFDIPKDYLLSVATDRVSTHNIVHNSLIPKKGYVLTALTVFWMAYELKKLGIKTHLVAYGKDIFNYLPKGLAYPDDLAYRAIVIKKLSMIDVEFIFRSREAGSLWKDYYSKGLPDPYGLNIAGEHYLMREFEETVFTPTEKSATDDPLNAAQTIQQHRKAYELSLQVYEAGRAYALARGIEIIDGKDEIGIDENGDVVLGDECLTPDACRFVKKGHIVPGKEPVWLDKEYLRAEAERIWNGGKKEPLTFSPEAIAETTRRYEMILKDFTNISLSGFQELWFD